MIPEPFSFSGWHKVLSDNWKMRNKQCLGKVKDMSDKQVPVGRIEMMCDCTRDKSGKLTECHGADPDGNCQFQEEQKHCFVRYAEIPASASGTVVPLLIEMQ